MSASITSELASDPAWFVPLAEYALRVLLATAVLLRRTMNPSVRLAWLVVGFALPWVGAPAYLLFGKPRLGNLRRRRYREVRNRVRALRCCPECEVEPHSSVGARIARLAERVGGNPVRPGNRLELYGHADDFLDALLADVARARHSVHMLFYIWLDDAAGRRTAHALAEAVGRGVACRVLVDSIGSRRFLRSETCAAMRAAGVEVREALPASLLRLPFERLDLRNHRKIVVVDGKVGYTGSQNMAEESFALKPRFAPWVDVTMRIEGPGAYDLQTLFVQDWCMESGEDPAELSTPMPEPFEGGSAVQVAGTGPTSFNQAMRELIQVGLHLATDDVFLTTPYFVPDEATRTALDAIARSGVQATLVVPARNDSRLVGLASRSFYDHLLDAGVHIWEYLPGLLHAKTLTVDGRVAVVSTANLDRRSFELNFECSVVVYDAEFAGRLRSLQASYLESSVRVAPEAWRRRPASQELIENAAAILTPLL